VRERAINSSTCRATDRSNCVLPVRFPSRARRRRINTQSRLRTNTAFGSRIQRCDGVAIFTETSLSQFLRISISKAIPFFDGRNRRDSQSRIDALFLRLISCRSPFNEQGYYGRRRLCNEHTQFRNITLQLAINGNQNVFIRRFRHVPARIRKALFLHGPFNFHSSQDHFQMLLILIARPYQVLCMRNSRPSSIFVEPTRDGYAIPGNTRDRITHRLYPGYTLEPRDWPDCCDPATPDSRGIFL
jgi:hypothetical protein